MTGPLIELKGVERHYVQGQRKLTVLSGADFVLGKGEMVALVAPSGAGKSTLLHLAGLLERPDAGDVILNGRACGRLSDDERTAIRRNDVGFVYQFHHLLPEFTALENIVIPQLVRGLTRKEADARAAQLLDYMKIGKRADHRPSELSGGEQQRVAIARAVANAPLVLFADEPTGNLDYTTGNEILDVLWRSCQERHQTIVLVTHDSKAAAYADRVHVIGDGRILETIELGRRADHDATALIARLASLGL